MWGKTASSRRPSSAKDSALNSRRGRHMGGILLSKTEGIARGTIDAGRGLRPASTGDGSYLKIKRRSRSCEPFCPAMKAKKGHTKYPNRPVEAR